VRTTPACNLSGMALDLDAIRERAERDLDPEWIEMSDDASFCAALHALGEPVPAELEAKADAQIEENLRASPG
jgi:hypothetical protein